MPKDFAIIKTGGKQYKVSVGDKVKTEMIEGDKEGKVKFDKVLLLKRGKEIKIGSPFIPKYQVEAKILSQGKEKKVVILKYKAKTRHKTKTGHRQPYTEVEITKI